MQNFAPGGISVLHVGHFLGIYSHVIHFSCFSQKSFANVSEIDIFARSQKMVSSFLSHGHVVGVSSSSMVISGVSVGISSGSMFSVILNGVSSSLFACIRSLILDIIRDRKNRHMLIITVSSRRYSMYIVWAVCIMFFSSIGCMLESLRWL